jgi:glycosyltransferase involved in cell wall biosynthesis
MNLLVTANTAGGGLGQKGMSGGDRIARACIHKWAAEGQKVRLFTGRSGQGIYDLEGREGAEVILTSSYLMNKFSYLGLLVFEFLATLGGCLKIFKLRREVSNGDVIYSSSDFWPDSIPALLLKLIRPGVRWVAGFYLFAPAPWEKNTPYKKQNRLVGLFYWLTQQPIYWLVNRFADIVFVTSQPDVHRFITRKRGEDRVLVIRGGVDIHPSEEYLASSGFTPPKERLYDACFVGRFHYQKGVLEMIDIWQLVCQKRKNAKLAMIGNGPLEDQVKEAIKTKGLETDVDLLGFRDGVQKYEVFKNSRIVVHPATYDSGGMAAAEAMAWGLPGVSFDLEALKTYYPHGMIKVPQGDIQGFADEIIQLLSSEDHYLKIAGEAKNLIREEWDWKKRMVFIYSRVMDLT